MTSATATDTGLRVVQLRISAFKGITVADITPPENGVVVVSGPNGAGKSSLIDAMSVALGGAPEARKVTKPVKKGSSYSQVVVDLGDLVITRQWNQESTWLTVTGADGRQHRSPQRLLNSLLGKLSFDPAAFLNEAPAKQRDMLLQATGLGDIVQKIDATRKDVSDDRRLINRDIKALTSRLDSMPKPSDEVPAEEVTVTELVENIRRTENANQQIMQARRRAAELETSIAETQRRIDELQSSLELQQFEQGEVTELAAQDPTDVSDLEQRVTRIDTINAEVRSARQWRDLRDQLADREQQATTCTHTLADLDKQKADELAAAELPIDGLGVNDEGITYKGVPFQDANTASRLQTATAIAMALNPTIRIIRISDGSLLDRANLNALHELAADRGYQVWVERVDDDDEAAEGIVIREGSVVANSYQDTPDTGQ